MEITNPQGFPELNRVIVEMTTVLVRDEKLEIVLGDDDAGSRVSTKFSKPFTFAATSGKASRSTADAASIIFVFIMLVVPFYNYD